MFNNYFIFMIIIVGMLVHWKDAMTLTHDDNSDGVSEVQDAHTQIMNKFKNDDISTFRPHLHGKQVSVTCFLAIDSFGSVSAIAMDYSVNVDLYVQWNDNRLTHNASVLVFQTVESIKKFWLPDIYFFNEKKGALHNVLSENIALVLDSSGNITYSTRLTLTLSCHMGLQLFPLDLQKCPLGIRSYAYNNDHVILSWRSVDPVMSDPNIIIPQFSLIDVNTRVEFHVSPLGNFSTLLAEFVLERSLGFYIIGLYLPSLLLVITSWISFWLHVDATPARASLEITSVLTLVTQSGSVRYTVPSLSYATAMDIWFSTCIFFVFAALLEFALVNYFYTLSVRFSKNEVALGVPSGNNCHKMTADLGSTNARYNQADEGNMDCGGIQFAQKDTDRDENKMSDKDNLCRLVKAKYYLALATKIDKVSRVAFPIAFLVFLIIFWVSYSVMKSFAYDDQVKII
ncbi:glycine receptor subunit alphaZ1-like [Ptychodera flava]|uniref:glycine receptor subunit alphaZ1-like n=1 Tax=Ptychodera flava TaxID=63121 RepID=UPI003969D86A